MLFTHVNPDLDAATSVWFARKVLGRSDELRLAPANWAGPLAEGDLALDIAIGVKGEGSCFRELCKNLAPEMRRVLVPLIDLVDKVDTGDWPAHIRSLEREGECELTCQVLASLSLPGIWRAVQRAYKSDLDAIAAFGKILDGWLESRQEVALAQAEADAAQVLDGRVAIVRDPQTKMLNGVLFEERGVKAVVFSDGPNLGVVRRNDVRLNLGECPEIRQAIAGEEGWFFHPGFGPDDPNPGFLAARGTRKAPATEPSRVRPEDLAKAVSAALERAALAGWDSIRA